MFGQLVQENFILPYNSTHHQLPLTLLKAWILFIDHEQLAFTLHDLAINTTFFNRSSNFHKNVFSIGPISYY
jgi:hypothetical protein